MMHKIVSDELIVHMHAN